MPHDFKETSSADKIAEREWSLGDKDSKVAFTYIDSCIVVAAVVHGGKILVFHLALMDERDNWFSTKDVDSIIKIIEQKSCDKNKVRVFGDVGTWETTITVKDAYNALIERLEEKFGLAMINDFGQGNYEAWVDSQNVVTNKDNFKKGN